MPLLSPPALPKLGAEPIVLKEERKPASAPYNLGSQRHGRLAETNGVGTDSQGARDMSGETGTAKKCVPESWGLQRTSSDSQLCDAGVLNCPL